MTRYDPKFISEVARDLARDTEGFCRHFFPSGRKTGNYWQIGDVSGAPGQSLSIRLRSSAGRAAGKWTDHATGEFGDLLDLLRAHHEPIDWPALLEMATSFLGQRPFERLPTKTEQSRVHSPASQDRAGKRLFGYGVSIKGTLAEAYLTGRGIQRKEPSLRFHSSAYLRSEDGQRLSFPALLAGISNTQGDITGCSRIFLDALGNGVADIPSPKRVLGDLNGNAIRFGPWAQARDLIVGEGLENTLSVGMAFPTAALASCLTANHMAAFQWPANTRRLWIAHDNDQAGMRGAETLRARFAASGGEAILLCPNLEDFNADLLALGVTILRRRLADIISAQVSGHDLWPYEDAA